MSTTGEQFAEVPRARAGVLEILNSPGDFFEALRRRPSWLPYFLSAAAIPTLVNYFVIWRVGFERIIADLVATSGTLDPNAYVENALRNQGRILAFEGLSSVLGTCFLMFLLAAILWLAMLTLNSEATYRQTLAVISVVTTVLMASKYLLVLLIVAISPGGFHVTSPLATTAAFYLSSANPILDRLYQNVDALSILGILLVARGLQKASPCLSFRTALAVVGGMWLAYNGLKIWAPWT